MYTQSLGLCMQLKADTEGEVAVVKTACTPSVATLDTQGYFTDGADCSVNETIEINRHQEEIP
jgi:hypothetical protein